jgi:hypothetical protein
MDIDEIMNTSEFQAGWDDASGWLEAHPRAESEIQELAERLALLLR